MNSKFIFLCGTGRSGTHLVGRSIASHTNIEGRIESPETFKLITKIATSQDFENRLLTRIRKYRLKKILEKILIKSSQKYVLEKSHPSLWIFKDLLEYFPDSKFIGVYRDPIPTINSMIKHSGVSGWYSKLPLTKENRFLGISSKNKDIYNQLSIEEKCATRWLSHYSELQKLNNHHPEKILIVKYENFVRDMEYQLSEIANFLKVESAFKPEKVNSESLVKWKNQMNIETVNKLELYLKNQGYYEQFNQ